MSPVQAVPQYAHVNQTPKEVVSAFPPAGVALVLFEAREGLLLEGRLYYGGDWTLYGAALGLDDVDAAVGPLGNDAPHRGVAPGGAVLSRPAPVPAPGRGLALVVEALGLGVEGGTGGDVGDDLPDDPGLLLDDHKGAGEPKNLALDVVKTAVSENPAGTPQDWQESVLSWAKQNGSGEHRPGQRSWDGYELTYECNDHLRSIGRL